MEGNEGGVPVPSKEFHKYIGEKEIDDKNVKYDTHEPSFFRDCPRYFQPTLMVIFVYFCYQYTGKMVVGAWIMYVGTPLFNYFFLYDSYNVQPKSEKAYFNWPASLIPCYLYIISTTIAWIFCLCLFSNGSV